jgi:protein-tyrosine phosphatase
MDDRRPWPLAFAWMLCAGAFFVLTYGAANWLAAQRSSVGSIVFEWERHIPFLAWTIVPYWSTDLLFALSFFVCSTRRELEVHGRRLIAAQIFCVTVFLLFPLRCAFVHPAPAAPFQFFFRALGGFDKPFNQAPSLHLALTTILWVKYSEHSRGWLRLLLWTWLALSGLSTLTTYQHQFIDVPTGVWVGLFCVVLFPKEQWKPRIPIELRRLALAALYLAGSACFAMVAALLGGGWWLGLWPAGALFTIGVAYAVGSPHLLRDDTGATSLAARTLLMPYLAAARINSWWWGRHRPPAEEIVPGMWLGRVPTRRERERMQIESLVNLAPELPADTQNVICRSVPMLDLVAPSTADLDAAVNAVDGLRAKRPTLICCALGCSRSASVMVAWLVAARLAPTVDSAIELVRIRRRYVVLSPAHRARLHVWAEVRGLP